MKNTVNMNNSRYTRVHNKTFRSRFQNHPHPHQGPVVIDLLAAGRHVKQRGGTGGSNMIDVQRTCHNSRLASPLLSLVLFSTNPCHDCIVIITQCYVSFNLSSLVVSWFMLNAKLWASIGLCDVREACLKQNRWNFLLLQTMVIRAWWSLSSRRQKNYILNAYFRLKL